MAMFGLKKSKPSEGSELVLAYLEDAQRVRANLIVTDPKAREVQASIVAVTEERLTLSTQGKLMVEKGESLGLILYLDGLRLKATAKLIEVKPGSLILELPPSLQLAERRKRPRARLNQREGAAITALTGLFDGIGLTGTIDNISEGGLSFKVGRAMNVKTQGPMHIGPNLLSVGQVFMLIKLSKLPKCPLIELAATVTHVSFEGGTLSVGFAFEAGKESLLAPIKALVASRTGAIPTVVPPKTRRAQEPKQEADEPTMGLAAPRPVVKKELPPAPPPAPVAPPAPPPEVVAVAPPALPPEVVAVAPPEPFDPSNRGSALLRIKKRTRGVLLAMPEGPEREAVVGFLAADGYGKIRVAATLTELLDQLDEVQLVFVDEGVAELQGLALASLLHQRLDGTETPVVLAEASVDAELVLGAQEVGVAQVLVKPYGLDAEFLQMIEGHLGIS